MFVLLAALSTAVILPALLWFVPETLQYKVVQQRASSSEGAANATKVAEAETILAQVRELASLLACLLAR
jgi:hypothetical protein